MNNAPDLVALGLKQARDTYRMFPDQPKIPTVVYGVKDGEINCWAKLHITDPMAKLIERARAWQMLKENGCDGSIFVAEAWVSPSGADRPSECPDREEVVVVDVSTPDYTAAAAYSMKRNAMGQVVKLTKRGEKANAGTSRWDFFAAARADRTVQ